MEEMQWGGGFMQSRAGFLCLLFPCQPIEGNGNEVRVRVGNVAAVNVVDAERGVRNAFYECLWPASNYLGAYAVVV